MSKTERPQTQVRGCVGNASQTELDRVDGLVHHHLAKGKLRGDIWREC